MPNDSQNESKQTDKNQTEKENTETENFTRDDREKFGKFSDPPHKKVKE